MPDYLIPSLLLQILVVGYTPGPANLFAFSATIKYGKREAMTVWAGLLTGFCITASVMAIMIHILGIVLGEYVIWLKYVGGAYILYLAWRALRMGIGIDDKSRYSYWDGVAVQLTNAKTMLFELTVYSTFVLPYSDSLTDLFRVAAILLLAGPAANLVWISMGSVLKKIFENNIRTIDIVTSIALAGCAIYMMI